MTTDLTIRQQRFVDAVLLTGNQTEAYRRAFDVAVMGAHWHRSAAAELMRHPSVARAVQERLEIASAAVDAAVLTARGDAPKNLERLDAIAALPVGADADPRTLPATRGAAETLLGIAEVIQRAGPVVDARSITVNMGARDERLAGVTVEELTAIIERLRGEDAGNQAIEVGSDGG